VLIGQFSVDSFGATGGKPNARVTSRKVGTVSFVSIADEGRLCCTKPANAGRKKDGRSATLKNDVKCPDLVRHYD